MAERTFTLAEAQQLLPMLEPLLDAAIRNKKLVEAVDAELQELSQRISNSGGMLLQISHWAERSAQRDAALHSVQETLAELDALGVQVKDLDTGLLDFPCQVGENVILLCWKLGEKKIAHWHGPTEGFIGRKPIDDSIARAGHPEKPN
ncbi:MAG TPA: DUF2203 domain-containing protein [Terriglobales bacterium]|nr:DUF2203 domain-containing protein [Terriglobales bacterium]